MWYCGACLSCCICSDSSSSSLQPYSTAPPFPLILVRACTILQIWHICPLCGLCALTSFKRVSLKSFSLGISHFLCSSTYLWLTNHPQNCCIHLWMLGLRMWLYLHAHDFGERNSTAWGDAPHLHCSFGKVIGSCWEQGFLPSLNICIHMSFGMCPLCNIFLPFPSFSQVRHKENSSKVIKFLQIL